MSESISILVVDDNPSMVSSMVDILEVKGFKVQSAYSGAEALEILRDHPVDILLTDVRMPDMNGVGLYRATRKTHPNLITLLMTAYTADDIVRHGVAEGIKTVLQKPVDIDALVAILSANKKIIT
jgi:CheY-like chemotaxis protein